MKDLVDKSMGIVTRIAEALARIKPTEPLRLDKREARKKRNCSDSSGNSQDKMNQLETALFFLKIWKNVAAHINCFVRNSSSVIWFALAWVFIIHCSTSTEASTAGETVDGERPVHQCLCSW